MKDFLDMQKNLVKLIKGMENDRRRAGEWIKQNSKFIEKVDCGNLDGCIVGVDGGMVKKSLHGIDLMLLRAIAVVFYYKNGRLESTSYYPDAIPLPEPSVVVDPFSDLEFEISSNLERQIKEVETAAEAVEKFRPDMLLLHGSIIPHYTFVPDKSSLIYVNYKKMIDAYQKLFDVVKISKTILAGVIEDSRGVRFCELISQNVPAEYRIVLTRSKDSNVLTYAMKKGEKTVCFPYSSEIKTHPILREFTDADKVKTFYIRLGEFDRPVRVDFLSDKEETDKKIASLLLACSAHENYSIPPVLIEADQRAKISETDLEIFYHDILTEAGSLSSLLELRRNGRPF